MLGLEDNVHDHEPGRTQSREKIENDDFLYH